MPLYNYACSKCGPFEESCTIKKYTGKTKCPACGKESERDYGNITYSIGLCDTNFFSGTWHNREFERQPEMAEKYAAPARAAGVSITGKRYMHSLARYPGDPQAWVAGLSDAKDFCKRNDLNYKVTEGALEAQGETPYAKKKRLRQEKKAQQRRERQRAQRKQHGQPSQ